MIKKKKTIACICSGAQLLISAKVVKNRKISGYYSMKDDILNAGAIYEDLPAVVDKNIITTAHYKDMGPWMKKSLEVFSKSQLTNIQNWESLIYYQIILSQKKKE